MHRFLPLLALAVLLPANVALAQSITCQTVSGPKSLAQLTSELVSAGYGGPWDASAMSNAYASASGAFATCGGSPAPATSRTIVLFAGGIDSQITSANWAGIQNVLKSSYGFSPNDFFYYSYDSWNVAAGSSSMVSGSYTLPETCNSLSESERLLTGQLRYIRDNHWADHVVVMGHSLGGVVAFDVLAQNPDLDGFVRQVVTVDSPLGGVSGGRAFWGSLLWGSCPALDDLVARYSAGSKNADYLIKGVSVMQSHGARVLVVSNQSDDVVPFDSQQVPARVNLQVNSPGGHSGALYDSTVVGQIASAMLP